MTRILCVEDDSETSLLLSEALTEFGYSVELAPDGESGLAVILNRCPDLVICDVRMPRMTGFELLENVVAAGPHF
jgi:CheY-like chemotaxis protein